MGTLEPSARLKHSEKKQLKVLAISAGVLAVRNRGLTGTEFAVAQNTLAGRFIIKKAGEKILFGKLELIKI